MKVEVIATDEFVAWWTDPEQVDDQCQKAIYAAVELLEREGVALRFPYQSAIEGSKYAFRELRKAAGPHVLRIIYAFDPARDAVLIIGGDKAGDKRFYEWIIPRAEAIWEQYLRERKDDEKP